MNFIFLYIGNNHPNWLSYFFRGVGIPPIRGLSVYHIQQEIPVLPHERLNPEAGNWWRFLHRQPKRWVHFPRYNMKGDTLDITSTLQKRSRICIDMWYVLNTLILISQAAFLSTSFFYFYRIKALDAGLFGELLDRSIEPQKLLSDALLAMLAESERRPLGEVEEVPKSHKGCITMAGQGYLEYGRRHFFQLLFKMLKLTVSWTSQDLLYVHIHVRCFHVMRLHLQQAVSVNQCSIIFLFTFNEVWISRKFYITVWAKNIKSGCTCY